MELCEDLAHFFGFDAFRPGQERAIAALEAGRDVQVLLPTSGGKSLCYQLPALRAARDRQQLTLVVSPLVALMEDQVEALLARDLPAALLRARQPWSQAREVRDRLGREGGLLYVSPERVATKGFSRWLADQDVAYVAIDEAHCISEWGHDFRPEYRQLDRLRALCAAPTIAVTATATPQVLDDIAANLRMTRPERVLGRFDRPNLTWRVEHHQGDKVRLARVLELLEAEPDGRVLVYAATRRRVTDVAKALRGAGHKVGHYHGGRTDGARDKAQQEFASGAKRVLVATPAFGMGVDLPDIRLVVHVQAPGTLEAYIQQGGRAGRDGEPARCVLLYGSGDAVTQARLRGPHPGAAQGWKALQDYVFGTTCREVMLAAWLGGELPPCGRCDVCATPVPVQQAVAEARAQVRERAAERRAKRREEDAVEVAEHDRELAVAFVGALKKPLGKSLVAKGLRGSRAKAVVRKGLPNNPHHGALAHLPERVVVRTLEELLDAGRLAPKGRKYPTLWLPDKPVRAKKSSKPRKVVDPELRALKNWRQREARRRRWKPYQVLTDATLQALLDERPRTLEQLAAIKGIGPAKLEKFGEALLEML